MLRPNVTPSPAAQERDLREPESKRAFDVALDGASEKWEHDGWIWDFMLDGGEREIRHGCSGHFARYGVASSEKIGRERKCCENYTSCGTKYSLVWRKNGITHAFM